MTFSGFVLFGESTELGKFAGWLRQKLYRHRVDQLEETAQRLDSTLQLTQDRIILGQLKCTIENTQAGVQLAALPFAQDFAKKGPHVGLRPEQFAALPGAVHLVNNSPRQQFSQVHANIAAR